MGEFGGAIRRGTGRPHSVKLLRICGSRQTSVRHGGLVVASWTLASGLVTRPHNCVMVVCSERTGHAGTRPAAVGVSCCSLPGLASGLLVTGLSRRPCARTWPPCVYWSLRTVTRRVGGRSVGRV